MCVYTYIYTCKRKYVYSRAADWVKKCTRNNCNEENVRAMQLVLWVSERVQFTICTRDFRSAVWISMEVLRVLRCVSIFFSLIHILPLLFHRCFFLCIHRFAIDFPLYFNIANLFRLLFSFNFILFWLNAYCNFILWFSYFLGWIAFFFWIVFWKTMWWVCFECRHYEISLIDQSAMSNMLLVSVNVCLYK